MKYFKFRNKKFRTKMLKTNFLILLLTIAIFCASIGYSYWNTQLGISGIVRAKYETYSISYSNIENSGNYPSSVIKNEQLQIVFTGNIPDSLTITMDGIEFTGYTYTNGTLTVNNTTKSPNGATSVKIYNGRTDGTVSFNNTKIAVGGTFKINFPSSANNTVTYPNAIITRIEVTFTFK